MGDIALAIGDPFGVGQTVTQGIISALARSNVVAGQTTSFYLQTDASINPGNSGGALVDIHSRLVGINSAIFSQSGGSIGIGFAIPVDMVKIVAAAAKAGDTMVHRPWLGAGLQAVTYDIAESFGLNRPLGALVTDLNPKGPAAQAGIKQGDLISAIDGNPVESPESLGFRFGTKPIGGTAQLTIHRGSKTETVDVKLVRAPDTPKADQVLITGSTPFAGLTAANMSPAVAETLSQAEDRDGVVIVAVAPDSNAAAVAFQKGDMILSVNGKKITTTKDLVAATGQQYDYWKLSILRAGQVIDTVLNGVGLNRGGRRPDPVYGPYRDVAPRMVVHEVGRPSPQPDRDQVRRLVRHQRQIGLLADHQAFGPVQDRAAPAGIRLHLGGSHQRIVGGVGEMGVVQPLVVALSEKKKILRVGEVGPTSSSGPRRSAVPTRGTRMCVLASVTMKRVSTPSTRHMSAIAIAVALWFSDWLERKVSRSGCPGP